jgi:hypothetical protein
MARSHATVRDDDLDFHWLVALGLRLLGHKRWTVLIG